MQRDIYHLKNKANRIGHSMRDSVERFGRQAQTAVRDSIEEIGDNAAQCVREGEAMVSRADQRLKKAVHKHPYSTLLISVAVGCAVGVALPFLMGKKWRR